MEFEARDLKKTFRPGFLAREAPVSALYGAGLVLRPGVFLLEGPNGSGKTTLLKALAGIIEADSGAILAGGAPAAPERLRALAACCQQNPRSFYFRLSTLENLRFFGALAGLTAPEAESRARELAARLSLSPKDLASRFDRLSEGNMQKVSLIRTLSRRAPLTLLDEPLRGLDAAAKAGLAGLLGEYGRDNCVLVAGHERPGLGAPPAGIFRLEGGRTVPT
jgi:ABC-type multidrug transport system ATPase subunit